MDTSFKDNDCGCLSQYVPSSEYYKLIASCPPEERCGHRPTIQVGPHAGNLCVWRKCYLPKGHLSNHARRANIGLEGSGIIEWGEVDSQTKLWNRRYGWTVKKKKSTK